MKFTITFIKSEVSAMRANYKRLKDGSIGKGTICFTEKQLEEYLAVEWEKRQSEIYQAVIKDVSAQLLAVFFTALSWPPYNWKKKRLLKCKSNVEFVLSTLSTGILGKKFTTQQCIDYIKEQCGIDFDKEDLFK